MSTCSLRPLEEMGRFAVVVVDPPWPLRKTGKRRDRPNQAGRGDMGYRSMSLAEISALPVWSVAEPSC